MNPTVDIPADAPHSANTPHRDAMDSDAPDITPSTGKMDLQTEAPPAEQAVDPSLQRTEGKLEDETATAATDRPVLIEVNETSPGSARVGLFSRRLLLRVAVAGILVGALIAATWLGLLHPGTPEEPAPAGAEQVESSAPAAVSSENAPVPMPVEPPEWIGRMRELERRRSQLLAKAEEVRTLQRLYRYGILELEEDAVRLIKRHALENFSQALQHRQMEFALQSIRSRQAFIAGLEKPLRWLISGSEELLYLQRWLKIDLGVLAVAEGIDMEAHAARLEATLAAYLPTADKLAMATEAAPSALEVLFKHLADQARQTTLPATESVDAAIAEEVCAGEMTRYSEVSVLRLKAARCLAESAATELFLNRVKELPAIVAQKLSEWPGDWLCLNGLKRISPEAARHMFAWQGRWISLNGLIELPADASTHLPAWGGQQIELMGLKKVEAVEHLVRWEEAGGKLFLPEEIRRQVDAEHRALRQPVASEKGKRG